MDSKSRWADNIMIGRWFRSFKYEEAYLTGSTHNKEAFIMRNYNKTKHGNIAMISTFFLPLG